MLDKLTQMCYNNNVERQIKKRKRFCSMANKMTKAEMLAKAKELAIEPLKSVFESANAEQVGDFTYAVPVEVNGTEKWVEITLTAKDMMTNDEGEKVPYDPFIVSANWQTEKEIKAMEKAEKDRKKAEKVKKANEKRELAKAKAQAKKNALDKAKAELENSDN